MASNLYCPNCGEIFGKDKECSMVENCSNCGEENIYNEYGYDDDLTDEELAFVKKKKRRGSRIISQHRRW